MSDTSGDTKPPTFADMTWSDTSGEAVSAAAEPEPSTSATDTQTATPASADAVESATTSPAATAQSPAAPTDGGPIPWDRHKAILESERQKLADAETKWQRVEWADALVNAGKTPEEVRDAVGLFDGLRGDYIGTLDALFRYADQNPQLQAHVRSLAGRWLGQSPAQQTAPDDDPEPQPEFIDERSGKPVFGADGLRKWHEWRERQFEKRLNERLTPVIQSHEEAQRQAQLASDVGRLRQNLEAEFNRHKDLPHFQEHKPAILEYLKSTGYRASIADAYNHVLVTKVLPSLSHTAKAEHLAELQRQAAASSAKPSSAAPVTPAGYKSFAEIPRDKW